jgi:hypothetical protein
MKSVFDQLTVYELCNRINSLNPDTQAKWGKMKVAQMLAHCNVTYEMVYEDKHPKPNPFMKLVLKLFVKKLVVTAKQYKPNNPTAPAFIIKDTKIFDEERIRLLNFINKTLALGAKHFDGKESHSFGKLTIDEWNNMFYKHLDHHLNQFGV